ncbi:CPBP family intramembrane glutamic endopeptidase [Pseudogracilibacillus auburnensis]|uniref:CPBP family intramembrane glutamic endopeptidase n=1 Tax=Pseudogracilibacillus auburnensis TaxID=1494959 RepID=UPI001A95E6D3|nr:CPBP family intramembrane glutamic endopeptidase [Pseudogracilibacillus auburnensis]MBO1004868.1 CPBP family intramembrane metalloprotease [Pseudogracilibacillus auburnensis]
MFQNKNKQVRAGWLIFIALLFVFIGQTIFMLPGMTLLSIFEISSGEISMEFDLGAMSPWMVLLTQGAGSIGGIAATLVVFRAINKKNPNQLGIQGPGRDFIFGLFLGAASIAAIFFILLATGDVILLSSLLNPEITWYTLSFLILFILVGFFEEMFFRGYVMKTMEERGNKKWVIYVVSALVFSLVHGTNPNVSILGLVNIALVGILFAYMFDMTKSLLLPIGYHITWNFFQGNVFGFAVSGTSPYGMYAIEVSETNDLLTGGAFGLEGGALATLLIIAGFFATYLYTKNRNIKAVN